MANQSGISEMNSLLSEVVDALDTYGDTIIINKKNNTNVTDVDGNPIITDEESNDSVGFAYNNKLYSLNLSSSNVINDSDMNMILKSDIEVEKGDIILHNNIEYKILDLEIYGGADIIIAYEVILGRVN